MLERLGLMRVQLADAARDQRLLERRRQRSGKLSEHAGFGGLAADGANRRIRSRHPFLEARDGARQPRTPREDALRIEKAGGVRKS